MCYSTRSVCHYWRSRLGAYFFRTFPTLRHYRYAVLEICYSTFGCRRTARLGFPDFIRTCQDGKVKIRANLESECKSRTLQCFQFMHTGLVAEKKINWIESRKINRHQAARLRPRGLGFWSVKCTTARANIP